MKKLFTLIAFLAITSALIAQSTTTAEPEKFKITWEWVVIAVTSLYEFLSRVVPTVKDYTVLGKVLKVLKWISDKLNLIKK